MKRLFVILLGACSLGAQAQQWLPPHAVVHEAIDIQPDVVAARARVEAARPGACRWHTMQARLAHDL